MKKPIWEVDENGEIIEHYLFNEDEIKEARSHGRIIVDFSWGEGFFTPKFDAITNSWVESKPKNEIDTFFREQKRLELDIQCTETILGRFNVDLNGTIYEFSYDAEAQSRFNGIGVLFFTDQITTQEWTAYQNGQRVRITLDKEMFKVVSAAARKHCDDNVVKFNRLLEEVDKSTSETINNITW